MSRFLILFLALVALGFSPDAQEKKPLSPAQQLLLLGRQLKVAKHLEAQQPQNIRTAIRLAMSVAKEAEGLSGDFRKKSRFSDSLAPQLKGLEKRAKGVQRLALQTALELLLKEKRALGLLSGEEQGLSSQIIVSDNEDTFALELFVQLLELEAEVREIRAASAKLGKENEAHPLIQSREKEVKEIRAKLNEARGKK